MQILSLLDAPKAFNRVEYVNLFNTLRDRNRCPIVLRIFMNMYVNQVIQIKWNDLFSDKCKISNGVKQGGCLSPSRFSIYLNNLILNLRNSNIGCKYRSEYMGVFGYADDLSLLCPSFTGIKEMLNICEKYAMKYDILFNATKNQLLYFGKDSNNDNVQPVLSMDNGKKIPYVTKCLHLGNSISTTCTQRSMINNAIADLIIKSNNLLAEFSFSNSSTLSVLFKFYCMNIYCSTLWRYNNHSIIDNFCVTWRKIIR